MRRSDIQAVGDLAGEASSVLTSFVRGMHAGIAGRVFTSIGPTAAPTKVVHNTVASTVYEGVDRGIRGAARAISAVAAEMVSDEADEQIDSRSGAAGAIAARRPTYVRGAPARKSRTHRFICATTPDYTSLPTAERSPAY